MARVISQKARLQVLQALAIGQTPSEIARATGRDPSTVWRWAQDPAFRSELEAVRNQMARDGLGACRALMAKVAGGLADLCDHEDPNVRLGAYGKIINAVMRGSELELAWAQASRGLSASDIAAEMTRIRTQLLELTPLSLENAPAQSHNDSAQAPLPNGIDPVATGESEVQQGLMEAPRADGGGGGNPER